MLSVAFIKHISTHNAFEFQCDIVVKINFGDSNTVSRGYRYPIWVLFYFSCIHFHQLVDQILVNFDIG